MQVSGSGKHDNYICISIIKNMPLPGRVFLDFDSARKGYKSIAMKDELTKVEQMFKIVGIQE